MEGGEEAGKVMGREERAKTKMISDVLGFGSGGGNCAEGSTCPPHRTFLGLLVFRQERFRNL